MEVWKPLGRATESNLESIGLETKVRPDALDKAGSWKQKPGRDFTKDNVTYCLGSPCGLA